jgi:glutathione S-transferase
MASENAAKSDASARLEKPVVYHIPVCPFSQRLEILLALKGLRDAVDFHVVDITRPRADWLLARTRGTTALPVLETENGAILTESLVILRYLESRFPAPPVLQRDPLRHAVESMLVAQEGEFTGAGYRFVMNQSFDKRADFRAQMLAQYARLSDFLAHHSPNGVFLFESFGYAEAVFTPMFWRFAFLDYYEEFELPATGTYARVAAWREACLAHPAAQQVTAEEIVKLYYDYAKGAGNGALLPGRTRSSFVFEPHWRTRPWPPRNKYGRAASDQELGLL